MTKSAPSGSTVKGSTSAKVLYKPVGIVTSILAGTVASALFQQVWKRLSPQSEGDAPTPLESEFPLKEIVLAAALQGAIFATVRAVVQRQGAKAFAKATGEWPGD